MMPSRKIHPIMPMARFAAISPHIMYTYALLHGRLFLCVCLMACQTVRKPNPRVKPAAKEANWISPFDAIRADLAEGAKVREVDGAVLRKKPPGSKGASDVACYVSSDILHAGRRHPRPTCF